MILTINYSNKPLLNQKLDAIIVFIFEDTGIEGSVLNSLPNDLKKCLNNSLKLKVFKGKQEKADDVPARLSVTEFVMTADAVRGMGDGDIDQGAKRMEDLMETLEVKGKKNQGAQDMFEVSERLSAVV